MKSLYTAVVKYVFLYKILKYQLNKESILFCTAENLEPVKKSL